MHLLQPVDQCSVTDQIWWFYYVLEKKFPFSLQSAGCYIDVIQCHLLSL